MVRDKKLFTKMFRVLNPNYQRPSVSFVFQKPVALHTFRCVRYKLISPPPVKNNVSGRGDPRRGGANSRVQRSPQGRVERPGLFYLFYYITALEMSSSRLVRRHGVVSFFLSFIVSPSSTTIKNSIVLCSFKKLTTTFFGLLFIYPGSRF